MGQSDVRRDCSRDAGFAYFGYKWRSADTTSGGLGRAASTLVSGRRRPSDSPRDTEIITATLHILRRTSDTPLPFATRGLLLGVRSGRLTATNPALDGLDCWN